MIEICLTLVVLIAAGTGDADRLFEEGKWEAAREAYRAALEASEDPGARAHLQDRIGLTFLGQGRHWEAEEWFSRSLETAETPDAHLHRARAYFLAGADAAQNPGAMSSEILALMNDALTEIGKALSGHPDWAEAHTLRGRCEWYRQDLAAAESAFRKALELEPGRAEAAFQLSALLGGTGKVEEARKVLDGVSEKDRTVRIWRSIGRLAGRAGDEEAARSAWLEAVLLAPGDTVGYQGLWDATALAKRFRDFEEAMGEVLSKHPDAYLAHYYLGFCYRYAKNFRKAIASFERTLELNPDETRARFWIAEIRRADLKDEDASIPDYLAVLKADPESQDARRVVEWLAYQRTVNGDVDTARKLYSVLVQADPGTATHLMNLALTEKEMGHSEKALELYREAEEKFPFDPQIPNDRGLLLLGLGRKDEAVAAFRKALDRDPDFLDSLENLGARARADGDLETALDCFLRAHRRVLREGGDAAKFRRYLDAVAREIEGR